MPSVFSVPKTSAGTTHSCENLLRSIRKLRNRISPNCKTYILQIVTMKFSSANQIVSLRRANHSTNFRNLFTAKLTYAPSLKKSTIRKTIHRKNHVTREEEKILANIEASRKPNWSIPLSVRFLVLLHKNAIIPLRMFYNEALKYFILGSKSQTREN